MPDWDRHYLQREVGEQTPASVLTGNSHLLPATGHVLDYACGLAANGCWMAQRGYQVTAWDSSDIAIEKVQQYSEQHGIKIQAEVRDLEVDPPKEGAFDIIIVGFYLHRPTLRNLLSLLKPGGLFFYQTFSGQQQDGRGPSNPNFRLRTGELLDVFADMQLLYYREDGLIGSASEGIRDQVLMVAAKK